MSPSKIILLGTYLVYSYTDPLSRKILPIWLVGVPCGKVYIRLVERSLIIYIFRKQEVFIATT
jgi:hypothetical protein